MSFVDIPSKVEFELATGVWTDITTPYIDSLSELRWDHGVDPFSRQPQSSTASFNLDNSTEVWSATNTASAYFNKFRQGIRVRISTTYSAVTKVEFLGTITDIKEYIPTFGPANLRVAVSCEGLSARLTDDEYGMAKMEDVDVDDALIAIATAAGITDYSFESTTTKLPVVIPQNGPMGDMVSVALGEPGSLLFEDGSGLNWLNAASMTGGHASPDHTWGSTIAPENDLEPDWRLQAMVARQRVSFSVLQVSAEDTVLYRHPFNADNGTPEKLAPSAQRLITGTFSAYPDSIYATFEPVVIAFVHSGTSLYAAIDSVTTKLQTNEGAGNEFRQGSVIKIDSEIMLVTDATITGQGYTNQMLTVERGYLNTIPANHTAPASPKTIIYHRPMQVTLTASPVYIGGSAGTFSGTGSTFKLAGQGFGTTVPINPAVGDVYQFDNEIVTVIAPLPGSPTQNFTFSRGDYGTTDVTHAAQTRGYRVSFTPMTDIVAPTFIKSSSDPSGVPADSPDIVGVPAFGGADHITYTGNKFRTVIRNSNYNSTADRWMADLVISGKVLRATDNSAEIVFEKAIPYVLGIPEGDDRALPFGAADIETAKGFAVGLLRAGRRPSPWLSVTFTVNISDNVSVRLAKIGDLVRYTGTGTNREDIDEWFRIVAVSGWVDEDGLNHRTFLLMPSHLNRKASAAWYTNFSWRSTVVSGGLGELQVKGVGSAGWTNDSQWGSGTAGLGAGGLVAAPSPALINTGSGDHVVSTQISWGNPANNSYPATTGGAGVTFRANSGATQRWEARFNPTQSLIYLWNSTDGVVASVAWTSTTLPEIEVMAQGTRIRVYVDCAALPVIDVVSTRFQSNGWVGPALNRTILGGGGAQPNFVDFYGQVI